MLSGAVSGTLYNIFVLPCFPAEGSLSVVPGTALVCPFPNLNANGCEDETLLKSK